MWHKQHGTLRILSIEDRAEDAYLLRRSLRGAMGHLGVSPDDFSHDFCTSWVEARQRCLQQAFTLITLDLHLPDAAGVSLIERATAHVDVPTIAITGSDEPSLEAKAAECGLQDFITKMEMTNPRVLARAIRFALHRSATTRRLESEATTDCLTGLLNRRGLAERLEQALHVGPTSMLLIDLDGFKQINDEHGHDVGDAVLTAVADQLRDVGGDHCAIARAGGDEFVVVLPRTNVAQRAEVADRIRRALGPMTVPLDDTTSLLVRASVGEGTVRRTGPAALYRIADQDMYRRKRDRNRPPAVMARERL